MDTFKEFDSPLHAGEREMASRYPNPVYQWGDDNIGQMIRTRISLSIGQYLARLPFFFIATSSPEGFCDASFRGREYGAAGPQPLVWVPDPQTVIFPDFQGNGLYQSLGNILGNPQIGMLFMDFERQSRMRINGRAEVRDADDAVREKWPSAQAFVKVTIQQAYGNCQARIPRLIVDQSSVDPLSHS